jgi:transglutaminase-like putative cysteine protease
LLAVWALLATAAAQAQTHHRFAAPGAWVDVVNADMAPAPANARAESSTETLLFDRQINVTAEGDDYYQRLVTRVLNPDGVDEYSQIDLVVDPTFQSLDIHWLTIVRDGVAIDQRPTARITELAQETDLRNRIYNGNYTINVLLSDVRPGDVVDYAFSLRSREQLFPGHFYARLDLGWSTPVAWQRVRVLAPVERGLRYRTSDGSPVPSPVTRGSRSVLTLESRDVPGIAADSSVPGWYSLWPFLEVGDLKDWRDVARRTSPLYRERSREGALVDEVVAAIRAAGGSPEQQALRALQWVQEEIRYTSISIGRGSHEPTAPNVVIERRFGDCKDMSLLLVAILRALGIEADVALVHSWRGRALDETLPSPYAFDHVIARAQIGGADYWLDATNSTQRGPLTVARSPSFARALVLGEQADGLAVIPKPGANMRERDVSVVFDARKGMQAPATLDITTQYRGALAESMRAVFLNSTPEQRQTDYVSYIARYYATAKMREPLKLNDDLASNVLEVSERYSLDSAFIANDEDILELVLHPDELYNYADPLGAGSRQAPLALEYPIRVRQNIVVHLPESWSVVEEQEVVDNPAFRYRGSVRYAANTLTLDYEYQALDDHVPAAAVAQFELDRARMYGDLGYSLTYNPALASGIPTAVAPLPMVVLLLGIGGSIWAAVTLGFRYDPEPKRVDERAPVGIRGWLLLPALHIVLSPFIVGWVLLEWLPFLGAELWSALPGVVAEPYSGSVRALVLAFWLLSIGLLAASVLLVWLFFTKRTSAPVFYIAVQWGALVVFTVFVIWGIAADLDMETDPARFTAETLRDTLVAAIWTAYMLSSRRVKATFVRRRRPAREAAATAPLPAA